MDETNRLSGAFNFRDLGGLRTRSGRRIRPGALFRSDTLQALTEADVATLVDLLGIELVVDLRAGPEAVEQGRGGLAGASMLYLNAPLPDVPVNEHGPPGADLTQFYLRHLDAPRPVLPSVVRVLAAMAGRPAVVHCAAGKDRTGLVIALVLALLDVDEADIVSDYLVTAANMPRIVNRFRTWPRYRAHMASVPAEIYQAQEHSIRAFLRGLDEQHGGAAEWAASRGISVAELRRLSDGLLEPS